MGPWPASWHCAKSTRGRMDRAKTHRGRTAEKGLLPESRKNGSDDKPNRDIHSYPFSPISALGRPPVELGVPDDLCPGHARRRGSTGWNRPLMLSRFIESGSSVKCARRSLKTEKSIRKQDSPFWRRSSSHRRSELSSCPRST
jgi:hypothetical protein